MTAGRTAGSTGCAGASSARRARPTQHQPTASAHARATEARAWARVASPARKAGTSSGRMTARDARRPLAHAASSALAGIGQSQGSDGDPPSVAHSRRRSAASLGTRRPAAANAPRSAPRASVERRFERFAGSGGGRAPEMADRNAAAKLTAPPGIAASDTVLPRPPKPVAITRRRTASVSVGACRGTRGPPRARAASNDGSARRRLAGRVPANSRGANASRNCAATAVSRVTRATDAGAACARARARGSAPRPERVRPTAKHRTHTALLDGRTGASWRLSRDRARTRVLLSRCWRATTRASGAPARPRAVALLAPTSRSHETAEARVQPGPILRQRRRFGRSEPPTPPNMSAASAWSNNATRAPVSAKIHAPPRARARAASHDGARSRLETARAPRSERSAARHPPFPRSRPRHHLPGRLPRRARRSDQTKRPHRQWRRTCACHGASVRRRRSRRSAAPSSCSSSAPSVTIGTEAFAHWPRPAPSRAVQRASRRRRRQRDRGSLHRRHVVVVKDVGRLMEGDERAVDAR